MIRKHAQMTNDSKDFIFNSHHLATLGLKEANEYWLRNVRAPLPVASVLEIRLIDGMMEPAEGTGIFGVFGAIEGRDTHELMVSNRGCEWVQVA